jgi:hypothetical protein
MSVGSACHGETSAEFVQRFEGSSSGYSTPALLRNLYTGAVDRSSPPPAVSATPPSSSYVMSRFWCVHN